jgi:ParB family chromosome partitioning protein
MPVLERPYKEKRSDEQDFPAQAEPNSQLPNPQGMDAIQKQTRQIEVGTVAIEEPIPKTELDSLVGNSLALSKPVDSIRTLMVALDQLKPNPFNPRSIYNEEALAELTESISSQGLICAPVVCIRDGETIIIDGLSRVMAARSLGWQQIIVAIRENVTDQELFSLGYASNEQRAAMCDLDKGLGYIKVLESGIYKDGEQLARQIASNPKTIQNLISACRLPADFLDFLKTGYGLNLTRHELECLKPLVLKNGKAAKQVVITFLDGSKKSRVVLEHLVKKTLASVQGEAYEGYRRMPTTEFFLPNKKTMAKLKFKPNGSKVLELFDNEVLWDKIESLIRDEADKLEAVEKISGAGY